MKQILNLVLVVLLFTSCANGNKDKEKKITEYKKNGSISNLSYKLANSDNYDEWVKYNFYDCFKDVIEGKYYYKNTTINASFDNCISSNKKLLVNTFVSEDNVVFHLYQYTYMDVQNYGWGFTAKVKDDDGVIYKIRLYDNISTTHILVSEEDSKLLRKLFSENKQIKVSLSQRFDYKYNFTIDCVHFPEL